MPRTSRFAQEIDASGAFHRQGPVCRGRVTADGASGFPVAAGRYQLIASRADPWSHAVLIARELLGLTSSVGLSIAEPADDGALDWRCGAESGEPDPATGLTALSEAYRATDPGHRGRVTVPVLYDTQTKQVVSDDFAQILLDFCVEWSSMHAPGAPQLYPRAHRAQITAFDALAYTDICDGVYRCGLAASADAYRDAHQGLFERLDWFGMLLSQQRYLMGPRITEADVRLFATLVRFDIAYHGRFRCARNRLVESPVLWAYARDLFQTPGFGDTVDFHAIKRYYDRCFPEPDARIDAGLPAGGAPDLSCWRTPHGRDELAGR